VDLASERIGHRGIRFLTVRKLRGGGFPSGQHAYRLSSSSLHLFPRLADARIEASYGLGDVRVSSGIPALDDLLARILARRVNTYRRPIGLGGCSSTALPILGWRRLTRRGSASSSTRSFSVSQD